MAGVDRSRRDYKTQEVFTPDWMVKYCLAEISEYRLSGAVCLDQACGDGQFLGEILINKMLYRQNLGQGIHDSFVSALDEIFGVDIEPENVAICRARLLCGCDAPEVVDLINKRIIVGNCLSPYDRISGQSDQDRDLMIRYFGSRTGEMLYNLQK